MKTNLKSKLPYLKKAFTYLKNYKRLGLLIIISSLLAAAFEGASIGALIPFLENLMNPTQSSSFSSFLPDALENHLISQPQELILTALLILMLTAVISKNIFIYLSSILIQKTSSLVRRDLQNKLFQAVTDADLKYYFSLKSGELLSSIHSHAKSVVNFVFTLLGLIPKLSQLLLYSLILLFISWPLTLAAAAFAFFLFPIVRFILNKVKNINISIVREMDALSTHLYENLNSIPLIKISGTEEEEKARFHALTNNLAYLTYQETKYYKLTPLVTEVLVLAGIVAIFLISVRLNPANIASFLPLIIAYLYVFLRLFQEINSSLSAVSSMFQTIPAFQVYEKRLAAARALKAHYGPLEPKALQVGIEFKSVSFGYSPERPIVKNFNLLIPKGSFVALVGSSGSGKTTIINLLTGLLTPDSGSILVDGLNLQDLNLKSWRRQIGYIPQDPVIFNQSLARNIAYGLNQASLNDIIKAAVIADIHEFIMTLPEQYETQLGEKGVKLSGGQKQRLAIARAVIRNPEILILDEATSSLDFQTEATVKNALTQAMRSRTVIAIAHRLSTIQSADQIAVLEAGQIIEQGTHAKLIKQSGLYQKLYELQFKN